MSITLGTQSLPKPNCSSNFGTCRVYSGTTSDSKKVMPISNEKVRSRNMVSTANGANARCADGAGRVGGVLGRKMQKLLNANDSNAAIRKQSALSGNRTCATVR